MKKRLRKRKHCGEFTELGRQLVVKRNRKDGFDDFLDAFIRDAIEANGCYCGGGGKEDKLDVVVEFGHLADDPEARLRNIIAWLYVRPDVEGYKIGKLFDIWHGNFEDMEETIEQRNAPDRQEVAPLSTLASVGRNHAAIM